MLLAALLNQMVKESKFKKSTHILGVIALTPFIIVALHLITFNLQKSLGLEDRLRARTLYMSLSQTKMMEKARRRRKPRTPSPLFLSLEGRVPSDAFMKPFRNEFPHLKKRSEAVQSPGRDFMGGAILLDKSTGIEGTLCNCQLLWLSPFKAKVSISYDSFPPSQEYFFVGIGPCWMCKGYSQTYFAY